MVEKMKMFTEASLGADQIADQLQQAHAASFKLTKQVVFVGSTAVVSRNARRNHAKQGILRIFTGDEVSFQIHCFVKKLAFFSLIFDSKFNPCRTRGQLVVHFNFGSKKTE
jgi:hypothetical protein